MRLFRHFIGQIVCAAFTHVSPVRGLWGELRCHRCGGIMGIRGSEMIAKLYNFELVITFKGNACVGPNGDTLPVYECEMTYHGQSAERIVESIEQALEWGAEIYTVFAHGWDTGMEYAGYP